MPTTPSSSTMAATTPAGIVLEAGQKLFGDGHAFIVNGLNIGANAHRNTTIGHAGIGVTLATDNTVMGVTLNGTANGAVGSRGRRQPPSARSPIDETQHHRPRQGGRHRPGRNRSPSTSTSSSSASSTSEGVHLQGVTGTFTAADRHHPDLDRHRRSDRRRGRRHRQLGRRRQLHLWRRHHQPRRLGRRDPGPHRRHRHLLRHHHRGRDQRRPDRHPGRRQRRHGQLQRPDLHQRRRRHRQRRHPDQQYAARSTSRATGTGLDITTTSGSGLTFTGGGTLNITGAANSDHHRHRPDHESRAARWGRAESPSRP